MKLKIIIYIATVFSFVFSPVASFAVKKQEKDNTKDGTVYTSLEIPLENAIIRINDLMGAPSLSRDSISNLDTLTFDLGYAFIDGEISDNALRITNNGSDSLVMHEKYCTSIFFNEDGSGNVYTLDDIEGACTDWIRISPAKENVFTTSKMSKRDSIYPVPSDKTIRKADAHVNSRKPDARISFDTEVSEVYYRVLIYSPEGESNEKILHFRLHYGD